MKRSWLIGWFALAIVLFVTFSGTAQTPSPSPPGEIGVPVSPIPVDPSLPVNRPPLPTASPSPSPTASPSPSPGATPPQIPIAPTISPPLPAAPTAPLLPVGGDYKDPNNRFIVAILKDYNVSAIAGTVLIEAPDGNLAYSVLAQPQSQLGITGGIVPNEALITAAQNAFRQGEGFQTGEVRSIPNGVQIDWTGNLTIAGQTQPVGGVILARSANDSILLVLIAATTAGGDRVLGAASTLSNSLRAS